MSVRTAFILFNYLLALLGGFCLLGASLFPPVLGEILVAGIAVLLWLEWTGKIPMKPPAWFSLAKISAIALPLFYFILRPEFPSLASGFLLFILYTRFIYKTEFNDYLYGHLIAIVCLLVGALFIQDLTFGALFLSFYFLLCWSLILYNMQVEKVGSRSHPGQFQQAGRQERLDGGFFRLTGGLVLASLVLTSLIFVSFPRMGLGLFSLKQEGVPVTGFSEVVELGDVGLIKQNDQVVLRAQFYKNGQPYRPPGTVFWRGITLDQYDGRSWSSTLPRFWSNQHRTGQPLALFTLDPPEDVIRQEVFMENVETPVVFTYGLPLQIDGNFRGLEMDSAYSFKTVEPPPGPRRFEMLTDIGPSQSRVAYPIVGNLDPGLSRRFLQLPKVSPTIRNLAKKLAKGARNDQDKANAILLYFMKDFTYSLDMKKNTDLPSLDEFLFFRKTGHCEYFASALTILLRSAGIPARMVNGFMGLEWNDMGEYMIVRQTHAHSWVEAFFPDQGWVTFDPTPPDPNALVESPNPMTYYMDMLRLNWQRYVVKYNFSDQVQLVGFFDNQAHDLQNSFRSLFDFNFDDFTLTGDNSSWGRVAGVVVLVGLGVWGFIMVVSRYRVHGSRTSHAALQYSRMLSKLNSKGITKHHYWTPREFLAHLDTLTDTERQHVEHVTLLYEKSRYAGAKLNDAEKQKLKDLVRQI